MKKNQFKRIFAGFLTVALVLQNSAIVPISYALESEEVVVEETASISLKNGTALIPSTATNEEVKAILAQALVENPEAVDTTSLEWEYYGEGKAILGKESAWGSIEGFQFQKKVLFTTTAYTVPALQNAADGEYQVRLKGTETEVTLTKAAKLESSITCSDVTEIPLSYNENGEVDYEAVKVAIWENVVAETQPELTLEDVEINYYAKGTLKSEWVPLEGGKVNLLDYPAISEGEQKIRISYAGNDSYSAASQEITLTFKGREASSITLNENVELGLVYTDDMTVDYDALKAAIWKDVVAETQPELTIDEVEISYYATAKTGALGDLGKAWVPLEGGKINGLDYPAIDEGQQNIRISYAGNKEYGACVSEVQISVKGRLDSEFVLKEGPYEVGIVYTEEGYDYKTTADAIYDAVVEGTTPEIDPSEVTVEYDASIVSGIKNYQPLDTTAATAKKFGIGTWTIRLSWGGNKEYKPMTAEVEVTVADNRLATNIVCKEGATFTYNMDADVMKQAILDQVIDWEQSEIPAAEALTIDDFEMSYYATAKLTDNLDGTKGWAPIEGGKGPLNIGTYPIMGAGEQKIRIAYKGNVDYRPSEEIEAIVTVQKAKVDVKVKSKTIFADEKPGDDFITTNPADEFDIYTVYAGVTSSVSTGVYLDLPAKYTESAILKVLDPIVEKIAGKSFTQMLQDGMTIGEIRELFSTQELLDALKLLNIDTGALGQILEIINKLPGAADNVRVGFGTPNRAGAYVVTAVTDSPNYETGVGIGSLVVKMHVSGVKLNWNQPITGKLTAAEAADFDFGATLTYNGEATADQSSVSYLYTGLTSKWKLYSSTTTAPTEPGRYVVTVVTLGGNYLASPITRTFQIVK